MKVSGTHYRTIWLKPSDSRVVQIIDQRHLPHAFVIEDLRTVEETARAIKDMHVRGAGLIGVTAGYGMYLAACERPHASVEALRSVLDASAVVLTATRPTAVNLEWAVRRQLAAAGDAGSTVEQKREALRKTAATIADEDVACCHRIGAHGLTLIEKIREQKKGARVNILTHCNAGWLAFGDYGTATAPIYTAHDRGIAVHVWVDETRPRNQGARLTAWELGEHGISHCVVTDNAGGHLMQHGMVDLVLVGSDRTTGAGDVANKIGTYLKALAARDNGIPFYVALPSSTIDWTMQDGLREIPIEERDDAEVRCVRGMHEGTVKEVRIMPATSPAANFAFDVTPARLVTGLITERGICAASRDAIRALFPEKD